MSQMQLQHLRRQAMQQAPAQPVIGVQQNKTAHRNENSQGHSNPGTPKQQTPGPSGINRTPPITAVPGPNRQPAAVPTAQRITQPQILMGPPLSLASVLPNYQAQAQQRPPPTFAVGPAPPQAIRMGMNHSRPPVRHVKAPSNRPPSGPSTSRPIQPLVRLVTQPGPRPAPLNLTTTPARQPSHPPPEAQPLPIPIPMKPPAQLQPKPSIVLPIRTMPSPVPPQLQVPSLQITEPAAPTEGEPPQVSPPDEANRSGSSQSQGSHGSDVMPCLK
ncbi:unnamed protein product, partial [Mesorhabditis spiculigera]